MRGYRKFLVAAIGVLTPAALCWSGRMSGSEAATVMLGAIGLFQVANAGQAAAQALAGTRRATQ